MQKTALTVLLDDRLIEAAARQALNLDAELEDALRRRLGVAASGPDEGLDPDSTTALTRYEDHAGLHGRFSDEWRSF